MFEMKIQNFLLGKFKGIIFDFNGVLWWDRHLNEIAANEVAKQLRGSELSQKEIDEKLHGVPNRAFFEYLVKQPLSDDELNKYIDIKDGFYRTLCLKICKEGNLKLSPGAEEFLTLLSLHKIPRTIATSSHKSDVDFFVTNLKLANWFDTNKIVYDNGKIKGKPAPDVYLQAAANLGLKPSECIVVEDANSGIESAFRAGIGMIIALGPKDNHALLKKLPGVQAVITNIGEIPDLFLGHPCRIGLASGREENGVIEPIPQTRSKL